MFTKIAAFVSAVLLVLVVIFMAVLSVVVIGFRVSLVLIEDTLAVTVAALSVLL